MGELDTQKELMPVDRARAAFTEAVANGWEKNVRSMTWHSRYKQSVGGEDWWRVILPNPGPATHSVDIRTLDGCEPKLDETGLCFVESRYEQGDLLVVWYSPEDGAHQLATFFRPAEEI